ncbi:alanine--tRNA ligase, partial [Patescibacteria group bacterium]|nr:alanine--tRNA ligase [Patescibacteria group bacterium]
EAKKKGALSFFGEKYGELVRVVSVVDTSKEFCGGIHVNNTGQIGMFHILSESSIGKGLRRIEAVAGKPAYLKMKGKINALKNISSLLKTEVEEIYKDIQELVNDRKALARQLESIKEKGSLEKIKDLSKKAKKINSINLVNTRMDGANRDILRKAVDMLKDKLKNSAVIVIGGVYENNIIFVGGLTKDLVDKGLNVGNIIKEISKIAGGSGGGRAEMATGGGKDISKLDKALQEVENIVKKFKIV